MCGRFVITSAPEAIRRLFGYAMTPNFPPRYNVAPTQPVPTVMLAPAGRQFQLMRWGLIPAWAKDPARVGLLINARAETVLDKPAFRNAMRYRRCLIPADGYYEWRRAGGTKQPLFVHPAQGGPIAFAGLAETWAGPNGEEMDTVAIVTTAASRDLAAFHPRMPVVIAPDAFDAWLDVRRADAMTALQLLASPPAGTFRWHEVSTAVNHFANDDAQLIAPISEEQRARETPPPKADDQLKLF
jgi:putative SOS response-associated peptidase YedK